MQPLWLHQHGYIIVGMSALVYASVCMGSSIRNHDVRSQMFVQRRQDGCECCWTWYGLIRVRMTQ